VNRPSHKVVIAFIVRKCEVVEVRLKLCSRLVVPVSIADAGPKAIGAGAGSIGSTVRINEFPIVFADTRINRCGFTIRIVVVAQRDDEIRVPALYEIGYIEFVRIVRTVVTDRSESDGARFLCRG
jgi:hypothetical protein